MKWHALNTNGDGKLRRRYEMAFEIETVVFVFLLLCLCPSHSSTVLIVPFCSFSHAIVWAILFEFRSAQQWRRSILIGRDGKCSINIWLKRNFNYNSSNAEQIQINKQTAFQTIILHFQWIGNTIKRASLFSYNYLNICL